MYTRCPACLTTFKVTPAQLEARGGMVRCGICSAIFHAEQRLLQVPPKPGAEATAPTREESVSAKKNKRVRGGKSRNASSRRRRARAVPDQTTNAEDTGIPTVTELEGIVKPRSFWRPFFWSLGNLALLILLAGQILYFYHDELAADPSWRPVVREFCDHAGCELRPRQDIARIELLQTSIAPHPKYENALRIRATLVNRAAFAQAYPGMEISLTSSAGSVLARRTFAPAQYLETPATAALTPNVVATALLDVTNPDGKAVGYEIRLVTP
ncbi:MAG: zinc-ribbon and DUF3426 domain-containing protein [Sulfuricaulis sp.]|nr:zinc-ribbon and DUF3426 domain-containing protein [Sulfuricaulis sp.]